MSVCCEGDTGFTGDTGATGPAGMDTVDTGDSGDVDDRSDDKGMYINYNAATTNQCSASYASFQRGTARFRPPLLTTGVTVQQLISPARPAHGSKPAASTCDGRMEQTDRRTDGRTQGSFIAPAAHCYAGSVNKWVLEMTSCNDVLDRTQQTQ